MMNSNLIKCGNTGVIDLVAMGPEHTPLVVKWRNDPPIRKWFKSNSIISSSSHEAWLAARPEGNEFNWIIEVQDLGPIGMASLYNIDWTIGIAEFGRFLIGNEQALGRGYGFLTLQLILRIAAASGIKEVYLEVKPDNVRAIAIYQKAGFAHTSGGDMLKMSCCLVGSEGGSV
jgi:diamine N-acetyltransferase